MKRVQDRWKSICKIGLKILVYSLIIILSPVIITTLLSLFIYKEGILRLIVKYFKPKLLQGLNDRDAFYATDRFWEDARASTGLILTLDGNVSLEQIRENFFNQVVQAESSTGDKLFPRLTQIPQSFGGYYFWQKANYFLIHEHVRPIENVIDETGLKKFAGTVLTLPFPNKRPLWEILVISLYSYKKSQNHIDTLTKELDLDDDNNAAAASTTTSAKSSALVIRMHASIADPDLMMRMVTLLCNRNSYSLQSLKLPDCVSIAEDVQNELEKNSVVAQRDTVGTTRALLKLPKNIHTFLQSFLQKSSPFPENLLTCNNNPTTVSWTTINFPMISKIVQGQNVERSVILMSAVVDALTVSNGTRTKYKNNSSADCDEEMNSKKNCASLSIMCSQTSCQSFSDNYQGGLIFLKSCEDQSERLNTLQDINGQLINAINEGSQVSISRYFLKCLAMFPHPIVRHANFHWLQGVTMIFQECKSDLGEMLREVVPPQQQGQGLRRFSEVPNDLIFIGNHQLMDVTPLCGLYFRHSVTAAVAIKFQNTIKLSVTINSDLLQEISTMQRTSSISSSNQMMDKQAKADHIMVNFGVQIGRIFEDGKDDHGFVRVPITM